MRRRVLGVLVAAVVLAGAGSLAYASGGHAATGVQPLRLDVTGWKHVESTSPPTPNASDGIGPGSYLLISTNIDDPVGGPNAQYICTANFLWDDHTSGATYLGAAGHCFLPADDKQAHVGGNPYVTEVDVCVADCAFGGQLGAVFTGQFEKLGQVVYARQTENGVDVGNDFGLVTVPASLDSLLRPAVPVWGGPTGPGTIDDAWGVCVYGNGVALGETFATKARAGTATYADDHEWDALMPSSEGDSGSAVVNCDPSSSGLSGTTAVGILTHGGVGIVGNVFGTTVQRAAQMVQQDWSHTITLRPAA